MPDTCQHPSKPTLAIFHNMARSGGTLVSRCLGAMEGVRLFSEIHPRANHVEYLNVIDQAARWYGLVAPEPADGRRTFVEAVSLVHGACSEHGLSMVLRDWSTIDFLGKLLVETAEFQFSLDNALAPYFDLNTCALVRDPIDQWLSTRRLKVYNGKLDVAEFLYGYRRYVELIGARYVRYEDFTRDPLTQARRICGYLAIPFDAGFLERWQDNTCITGDNKNSSRGSQKSVTDQIRPLPRRAVEPETLRVIESNADYQWLVDQLGY